MESTCRCGFSGNSEHPCHGNRYQCRKPAKERFYNARPAALPGMQMKLSVDRTFACDACWSEFEDLAGRLTENEETRA